MSKSKSRCKRVDKYSSEPNYINHYGRRVPLGGVAELLLHCDAMWFHYLEQLSWNNPSAPNPFELDSFRSDIALWNGLKERGYVEITPEELFAKRDKYIEGIENGAAPYRDDILFKSYFLVPQQQN